MSTTINAPFEDHASGSAPGASPRQQNGWPAKLRSTLPNLAVFGLLACVFLLGHATSWTMPKFGSLFGAGDAPPDWCEEHLVAESRCVECHEALMPRPKEFGFCREHGVTECVLCHPELAQVSGEPQQPQYDTAKAISLIDRPQNNSRNTLHKHRVQFDSAEAAVKSGVEVDVVHTRAMSDSIAAVGELTFDPTRVAHLSVRSAGTVALVLKSVGDTVAPGDLLALVDAVQVGQAKSQLLQAIVQRRLRLKTVERLRSLAGQVAGKNVTEAESALEEAEVDFISARQALINLGLDVPEEFSSDAKSIADDLRYLSIPQSVLSQLPAEAKSANLIPLRASYEGVVVSMDVVAGEVVETSTVLFVIADPRRLWLTLNVRHEDARHVAVGLPVEFHTDDGAHQLAGKISWTSPAIDERTRTLQVRVNIENLAGELKDKAFGSGRIVLREEPQAVVVPREAVQSTADASFVFVRDRDYLKSDAPKVFHARQVRLGAKDDNYVELLAGVLPGEVVATKGSAVLLAHLMRSDLGAGCACHAK